MVGVSIDLSSTRHAIPSGAPAYSIFVCSRRELFLAFQAPEGRASVLGEPPHDSATPRGLAFLAFAVVDLKRVLEIAEFAFGLAMVAQRRAAGLDGLIEHRVDRRDQSFRMIGGLSGFGRQRRGQPSRRQMRTIQRLADIDIAE